MECCNVKLGSRFYKTSIDANVFFGPHISGIKKQILSFRHTNMSSAEMMAEIGNELVLHFGSIEKALEQVYDLVFDEAVLSDV